jgi:hypothetical protein
MGDEHVPLPPETLAELAEGRAFRLLLECHAQEAITRVLRRVGWMLAPMALLVGGAGAWIGWSKYTSWQDTIVRVDTRMRSLDAAMKAFEADVLDAQKKLEEAGRVLETSREVALGVQSGVAASASLLQRQADTLSGAVSAQAAEAKANADAVRADKLAVARHKAEVEGDVKAVQEAAALSGKVDKLWQQVNTLQDIQVQLASARLFHLVLLTAHRQQTIEIRDPRSDSGRPYELTFRSAGLRGERSPRAERVRVVSVSVDVREPGGARFSRILRLEDDPQMREFRCVEGTPFEVVLDFRYSRPLVKDFVALRIRPGDRCPGTVEAAR